MFWNLYCFSYLELPRSLNSNFLWATNLGHDRRKCISSPKTLCAMITKTLAARSNWPGISAGFHDDVIKWKHFPRNWPLSLVNFPHKGQWRGALMFSLIYAWINDWVNNHEAGDLRRQHGHYDVIVMQWRDGENCMTLNFVKGSRLLYIRHIIHVLGLRQHWFEGYTVETLYSTIYYSKYFIQINFDKSTQYVALWTHKRHPIPRPFGRAMECLLWVLEQKLIVL